MMASDATIALNLASDALEELIGVVAGAYSHGEQAVAHAQVAREACLTLLSADMRVRLGKDPRVHTEGNLTLLTHAGRQLLRSEPPLVCKGRCNSFGELRADGSFIRFVYSTGDAENGIVLAEHEALRLIATIASALNRVDA